MEVISHLPKGDCHLENVQNTTWWWVSTSQRAAKRTEDMLTKPLEAPRKAISTASKVP